MGRRGILRPRLKRQVKIRETWDWLKRANVSKKNIPRFFSYLYAQVYGGNVRIDPWGNNLHSNSNQFNPDIEREKNGRKIYTEEKSTSVRSSQIHSPLKQEENNLYYLLREADEGKEPLPIIEYALFRYGPWSNTGLHKLSNEQLVKNLSEAEKKLVILPFNAFLYLAAFSRHEIRNQETSEFNRDTQRYHVLNGSTFTGLFENNHPITDFAKYPAPILEKLCLEDIEVEHSVTPNIKGNYFGRFIVEH